MITRGAVRDATRDASHTFRVVRDLDPSRWSAFVDGHPQGSIFHTPEMHRVFGETQRHNPAVWAASSRTVPFSTSTFRPLGPKWILHFFFLPSSIDSTATTALYRSCGYRLPRFARNDV